ncbi:hypothetical protein EMIT0180MI3_11211 [Priestia megaterium]
MLDYITSLVMFTIIFDLYVFSNYFLQIYSENFYFFILFSFSYVFSYVHIS